MGRRKNKGQSSPADANVEANDTVIDTGAETAVEQSNDDDAVMAALENADQPTDGDTVETMETEQVEVELDEQDEDAVLAELDAEEEDSAPAPTSKKKGGSKKSAASTPAVVRQFCDVADHLDPTALKTALDGITAKKVAEKANNVVQAIETGKKLSGFTALAIKTLNASGRVTSKDLVEAYQADGKSLGTARAQAQQMTALFKSLGIAQPDPNEPKALVACDNGLVKELATLAA